MVVNYLNGDIIRCPDSRANYIKRIEKYEQTGRCSFGVKEENCPTWAKYSLQHKKYNCRCDIAGVCSSRTDSAGFEWRKYLCPKAQKRYLNTIKSKSFTINSAIYRKMSSAAHYLVKESKHKTIFITLTFPKYKPGFLKLSQYDQERKQNESFSKFIENLRKNYDCEHYVAVRERGENYGRVHFHVLLSLPYIKFAILNRAWLHSISDYCYFSENALQTERKKSVVKNPLKAVRYICKYFSKARGQVSKTRLYFISNNLLSVRVGDTRQSNIKRTDNINITNLLQDYKGVFLQTFDHVSIFRITEPAYFNKFCQEYLYPLFELSVGGIEMNYFSSD